MRSFCCALVLVLPLSSARAQNTTVDYGPPTSPLSWKNEVAKPGNGQSLTPRRDVLGLGKQPDKVGLVEFTDECSFGEPQKTTVWLAHYDSIPVMSRDSSTVVHVAISLTFSTTTNELLCAFTDPSSVWARSPQATGDVESFTRWRLRPADYDHLRSTVPEVLAAVWRDQGVGPHQAGQIILRPRFNSNDLGPLVLHEPPSNIWLVEVRGRFFMQRDGITYTTRLRAYRDGDLKGMFGIYRP